MDAVAENVRCLLVVDLGAVVENFAGPLKNFVGVKRAPRNVSTQQQRPHSVLLPWQISSCLGCNHLSSTVLSFRLAVTWESVGCVSTASQMKTQHSHRIHKDDSNLCHPGITARNRLLRISSYPASHQSMHHASKWWCLACSRLQHQAWKRPPSRQTLATPGLILPLSQLENAAVTFHNPLLHRLIQLTNPNQTTWNR